MAAAQTAVADAATAGVTGQLLQVAYARRLPSPEQALTFASPTR